MKRKRRIKPYSPQDPDIAGILLRHCESGWSPQSFSGKLQGGTPLYLELRRTNPEFKEIAERYIKVQNDIRSKSLQSALVSNLIK